MSAVKTCVALAKRELWENRSLWIVQLVIAAALMLTILWGMGALIWARLSGFLVNHTGDINMANVHSAVIGGAVLFNVALVLLAWFYLMDALYADRKDRSVLFWRSLPVSDTATVLSKLFTAMVTAPAIAFMVIVGFEIVAGLLMGLGGALTGLNLFAQIFHPDGIIIAWITLAFAFIVQSLWLMPYYGWFLLCSAWAKKLPLAWTVLVPLGAFAVEGIVLHSHYLWDIIVGHLGRWFTMLGSKGIAVETLQGKTFEHHGELMTIGSVADYLMHPEIWIGVVVGAIFVAGAIWLRRHRSEI